jgi:hypothetical protein
MNPILIAGYGLAGALGLWWLVSDVLPSLATAAAPGNVRKIVVGTFGAYMLIAASSAIGLLPYFMPSVALILPIGAFLLRYRLIEFAGGPVDKEHLRQAYYAVLDTAYRSDLTPLEFDALQQSIKALDRFRNSETAEFISLTQEEMADWANSRDVEPDRARRRDLRIRELGDRLWLSGTPSLRRNQGPTKD